MATSMPNGIRVSGFWSSIDITSAFLNADIHDDDIVGHAIINLGQNGHRKA